MKKIITLIVAVGAIAFLGWYVLRLNKNKGQSDTELIEFAIEDVSTIDKIVITDTEDYHFEIIKKEGVWVDKDGDCIMQENALFVIDALKNIEFKGYLPDNALESTKLKIASQNTKVEIFQNGEWTKTWYLGPSSQDHYGQVMLLDTKDSGPSAFPVIMKLKGVHGIISPRFYGDKRKWLCTNIFSLGIDEISKVEVKMFDEPARSFSVVKNGSDMKVYQQDQLLVNVDTAMIFRYLNNYKKIHYNKPNYVLNPLQVDSVKQSQPFAILTVTETDQSKTDIKCFRISIDESKEVESIEVYDIDQDHFWAELPSGQLVKCQYFVFNPLFFGHIYFPMNQSGFTTVDGFELK